jgi:hypothetical protein
MKVKIENYRYPVTCYRIAEWLCFWAKPVKDEYSMRDKPQWVHNFGEWLTYGSVKPEPQVGEVFSLLDLDREYTWFARFLSWVQGSSERTVKIKIDPWDTWSMDHTLALIIVPMLKQLQATKHGAPYVDDEDVPDDLKSTAAPPKENEWDTDENHFKRWDWVLDEMIWAFEHIVNDDWQEEFYSGSAKMMCKQLENGMSEFIKDDSPDAFDVDMEGMKKIEDRIKNGTKLFGKYYQGLWD